MAFTPANPNGQATKANSSPVTIASDQGALSIAPSTDVLGTGTLGALNAAVTITANGISGCIISLQGTLVGTVVLEGSIDGFVTSQNISVMNLSTVLVQSTGMTASGYYRGVNGSAWPQLRIRVSAYTSGSSTGTINASTQHTLSTVVQPQAANLNMTVGAALPAGANVLGKVGIDQTTPGTTNAVAVTNASLAVTGTFFQATQPVSIATNTPDVTDRAARLLGVVSIQKQATYRASTSAVFVPAVTAAVPFFTIYGSASKTIKVQSIVVSGITLTAVAYINIGLRKYSTAATGGTSTGSPTATPLDSTSAAATATVLAYTAIPTAGTTVGDISSRRVLGQSTTAAAAGIPQIVDFDFSPTGDTNSPVLRGTAQGLGLYFITAPATTISCLIRVEWTEE